MRTLKNLPVPQDGNDVNFPDGQIRNETTTESGTPVVRELYGDIVTNIYAILRDAGIVPTETEDSSTTQYQLLQALKVFSNELNDLQQLLTVAGTDINTAINFDNLPANYVFIGKVTEDILASTNYSINSTGAQSYPISTNSDITASSIAIVVLNAAGSTIVGLNSLLEDEADLHVAFGNPLAFNDSSNLLYISNGNLFNDFPTNYLIQNQIQVSEGSLDVKIVDAVLLKNRLVCFTFDSVALKYKAFAFDATNFGAILGEVTLPDVAGTDNQPYMYCDGDFIYFSNSGATVNSSLNDYSFGKFAFNEVALTLTSVSTFDLDNNFDKTTNAFITDNKLFTFVLGELYEYDLAGAARVFKGNFNTTNGLVFKFNGKTYYSNGNVATKWNY